MTTKPKSITTPRAQGPETVAEVEPPTPVVEESPAIATGNEHGDCVTCGGNALWRATLPWADPAERLYCDRDLPDNLRDSAHVEYVDP